jgi:hypothetical protein
MTEDEQTSRRARRTRTAAWVLLMIAGLIIAGCGGGSATSTVASLPGHTGAARPRSAPFTVAQSDADTVEFASCMRAHGVQMSDPVHRPGHAGLSIDLPTQDAGTRVAYGACNQFIQPLVQAKQRGTAATAASTLPALTSYARCMRAHDINMLDPTPEGELNLGHVPGISDDFGRYSPQFRQADGACRHPLPASIHDDGTGP